MAAPVTVRRQFVTWPAETLVVETRHEQQEGDLMLRDLATWWRRRRQAREARGAFDSVAQRELYEALDHASMVAPGR